MDDETAGTHRPDQRVRRSAYGDVAGRAVAFEVDEPIRIARLAKAEARNWSEGVPEVWTRVRPRDVTGRRLRPRMGDA